MTELLSAILASRDRILMLLILTIAVLLVTYLIYTISGRTGIVKYLPGMLLTGAGVFYLYRGFQQLTTHAGLNELISAVLFVVIGLIGVCFAMILGILHHGEGQKTKRRAQALDYLQEARSTEAVVYPERKEVEMAPAADPVLLQEQEEHRQAQLAQREREDEENRLRQVQQRTEQTEKEEQERARQEALRAEQEREAKRIATVHERLLEREALRYSEERNARITEIEQRREERKLARLEKELARKNALREEVIAYNRKAEEINAKEGAGVFDQLGLFVLRVQIKLKKWAAAGAGKLQEYLTNAGAGISRGSAIATSGTRHTYRKAMTRFEARKKPEEATSDPDHDEPIA